MTTPQPGRATGARRPWRDVDGIVLLDKPTGLSSNHALQRVRRTLLAAKGGHAGTLDPMATGMLPLCFGHATKACGSLLGSRKAYRARLRLGVATDTGDAEGDVVRELPVPGLERCAVERVLAAFVGTHDQQPPMYSALKRDGRPLYELARAGVAVERAPRRIQLERLDLVATGATDIEFDVICSKGTYIRVLGEDIGAALGTCGHLVALRRLWVAPFEGCAMVTLEEVDRWSGEGQPSAVRPEWLLPVDAAFTGRPRLELTASEALHLRQGRVLEAPADVAPGAGVRAYGPDGAFLGLVEVDPDRNVRVQRLFVRGADGAQDAAAP